MPRPRDSGEAQRAAPRLDRRGDLVVAMRRHDDTDPLVILGGGSDHGRSPDIDLLDRRFMAPSACDRLLEGIQVGNHQLERRNALVVEFLEVLGGTAVGEDPAVDGRMQRLHPPAENLGGARDVGHPGHGDSVRREMGCGASGRDDLHPGPCEAPGERRQARLVRYRHECPVDGRTTHPCSQCTCRPSTRSRPWARASRTSG